MPGRRASERGKRFIVFKPEIERTRWKERRRKEERERERPYKKGEMVFERRRVGRETAAKSKIEGRRGGSQACGSTRGVGRSWKE